MTILVFRLCIRETFLIVIVYQDRPWPNKKVGKGIMIIIGNVGIINIGVLADDKVLNSATFKDCCDFDKGTIIYWRI